MLIALPQADGYYAGTLFAPFEGAGGLDNTTTQEDFQHSIQSTYLGKDSSFSLTDTPLANLPPLGLNPSLLARGIMVNTSYWEMQHTPFFLFMVKEWTQD